MGAPTRTPAGPSESLDGGSPWATVANYVDIALHSADLATVAHYESDPYPCYRNPRIAYSWIFTHLPLVARTTPEWLTRYHHKGLRGSRPSAERVACLLGHSLACIIGRSGVTGRVRSADASGSPHRKADGHR